MTVYLTVYRVIRAPIPWHEIFVSTKKFNGVHLFLLNPMMLQLQLVWYSRYTFVCLSVYLSICLSFCLSVCISLYEAVGTRPINPEQSLTGSLIMEKHSVMKQSSSLKNHESRLWSISEQSASSELSRYLKISYLCSG